MISLRAEKSVLEEGVKRLVQQSDSLVAHRQTLEIQTEDLEKTNQSLLSDNSMLTPPNVNHHNTQLDDPSSPSVNKVSPEVIH